MTDAITDPDGFFVWLWLSLGFEYESCCWCWWSLIWLTGQSEMKMLLPVQLNDNTNNDICLWCCHGHGILWHNKTKNKTNITDDDDDPTRFVLNGHQYKQYHWNLYRTITRPPTYPYYHCLATRMWYPSASLPSLVAFLVALAL